MSFQEFLKAPNRLTPRETGFLILAGIIAVLALYGLAAGNSYLAGKLPDGGEFHLLRIGGRSFLFDRIEPYSGSIPARVQNQVYGRAATPGEDAYILDIPFHLLMLFFPLALFPDATVARAFWMALSEIALAGSIYFIFRLMDRLIPFIFIGLIAIASFSSYYAYHAFLEGTVTIFLGLAYAGILLSLRAGIDELSGALLVLSAFQWEIGGLFLLFIVLWVFWERRWRVFAGAAMLSFILLALSFFWYPGWVLPFLRAAWNGLRVGSGFSTHEILLRQWPGYGSVLGWVLTVILIVALGYEWQAARGKGFNRFVWVSGLTLALTPLLGQRVEMDQLVPLTFPIIVIIVLARERWQRLGNGVALLLLIFFFATPWLLFTQGLPQGIQLQEELLYLFWPVFAVIGLYWIRWWMLRPPRTWLDGFQHVGRR